MKKLWILISVFLPLFLAACGTTDFSAPDVRIGTDREPGSPQSSEETYLYAELSRGDFDEVKRGVFIYKPLKGPGQEETENANNVIFDLENPVSTESGIVYRSVRPVPSPGQYGLEVYTRMELVKNPDKSLGETISHEVIIDSPTVICEEICQ